MSARTTTFGIQHLTVVPTNFEPEASVERSGASESDVVGDDATVGESDVDDDGDTASEIDTASEGDTAGEGPS